MSRLAWDEVGERTYETGVDRGVLYIPDEQGAYVDGVAWNGLTAVTESPSGAEPNAQYADNIKYLNLFSAEEFSATIEAFTYPDEFAMFDGLGVPTPGIAVGQQHRPSFGLCYRTKKGNDIEGDDHGYKLHLVYGCKASPSEKAYSTVNDTPAALSFSWSVSTTPVAVTNMKPSSILTVDSTEVDADTLAELEDILYGTVGVDPQLPLPDTVISMFSGTVTVVTPNVPTFNSTTHVITIPTQAGIVYYVDGVAVESGPLTITQDTLVEARAASGYIITPGVDNDWFYDYV